MNPRVSLGVGILSLLVWSAGSASASSLLINGSFELGPAPFSNQDIDIATGSTAITGWVVTGAGIDLLEDPWNVSDGLRAVDLDGRSPGGIEQTFATTIGQLYLVSFDLSGNPGNGLPSTGLPLVKDLRVTVDGFSHDYSFDSAGLAIEALTWETIAFLFVATDTSATLAFSSLTSDPNGAYGALIDNVSVRALPEPSTLALLCAVGVIASALRRRFASQ